MNTHSELVLGDLFKLQTVLFGQHEVISAYLCTKVCSSEMFQFFLE